MLKIEDLHASINGKEILKGINLEVNRARCMRLWDLTVRGKVRFPPY